MNPWDPITYTVTPAAKILARCVTSGTMTQEELNALPQDSEVFSTSLLEAEQLNRIRRDLDQANLELELLKLERDSADVTHTHYLSQRYVVELMGMVVEFIQNLEVKIKMVQAIPKTDSYRSNLNSAITQLLAQVTEVENLYRQVLKRRGHLHTNIKDMSS